MTEVDSTELRDLQTTV